MLKKITALDADLLIYINNLGSTWQDSFWYYITQIWFWAPLYIAFLLLVAKCFKRKKALNIYYTLFGLLATTFGLTYLVKILVLRARPVNNDLIFKSLRVMIQPVDYSFFSGHACNSFAITTFFYLFLRQKIKYAWLFYAWPLLFSYSRLYFAVHFPSDVFVGAVIGTSLAFLFYYLHKKYTKQEVVA